MITDTHTHLYVEQFDADREAIILRAKSVGVSRFFIPAIDSSYHKRMFDLEKYHPNEVFNDGSASNFCEDKLQRRISKS